LSSKTAKIFKTKSHRNFIKKTPIYTEDERLKNSFTKKKNCAILNASKL